MRFGGMG